MNSARQATSTSLHTRYDHRSLCLLDDRFLEELMQAGTMPDPRDLEGWEFNGFNTGDLAFAIRKFRKGFYASDDPAHEIPGDGCGGYNVNIVQNGFLDDWQAVIKKGTVQKHSYYRAYPVRYDEPDNLFPNGLLLNYDCPRTPKWNPASGLRDYLVQVYPDNPDLLLGKAYFALAGKRIFVSFFVLERSNKGS